MKLKSKSGLSLQLKINLNMLKFKVIKNFFYKIEIYNQYVNLFVYYLSIEIALSKLNFYILLLFKNRKERCKKELFYFKREIFNREVKVL